MDQGHWPGIVCSRGDFKAGRCEEQDESPLSTYSNSLRARVQLQIIDPVLVMLLLVALDLFGRSRDYANPLSVRAENIPVRECERTKLSRVVGERQRPSQSLPRRRMACKPKIKHVCHRIMTIFEHWAARNRRHTLRKKNSLPRDWYVLVLSRVIVLPHPVGC
jgi:hypothetical protein